MRKRLIAQHAALIAAPPDAVRDALFDELLPDADRRGTYTVEDSPGHTSTAEVADYDLALQGGWWHRGEWHVEPHPEGTVVRYGVYNVATTARWGVALANRLFVGFDKTTRDLLIDKTSKVAESLERPPPRLIP